MAKRYDNGNVKWSSVPKQWISPEAANQLLDELDLHKVEYSNGFMAPGSPSRYRDRFYYNGSGSIINIYLMERKETRDKKNRYTGFTYEPRRYYVRTTAPNTQTSTSGGAVLKEISTRFKTMYGIGLKEAFGYSTIAQNCIPKPLNETTTDGRISPEVLYPFYKVDASSAYAFEASKSLPTMNGHKIVEGYAAPTEDFPFAFYLEEGTMAIWGEFDNHPIAIAKQTLLCPASPYSLLPIFEEIYAEKENAANATEKQFYKDLMNFFVGMLHYMPRYTRADKKAGKIPAGKKVRDPVIETDSRYDATCPRYAALAAVIKARCNERMLNLRDEIESVRGNKVWLINTDAVGWAGKDMPHLYTTEKGLGNLLIEHKNAEAIVLGSKKYQIRDEKGVETKWAGVAIEATHDMEFGGIRFSNEKCVNVDLDPATARFVFEEAQLGDYE